MKFLSEKIITVIFFVAFMNKIIYDETMFIYNEDCRYEFCK